MAAAAHVKRADYRWQLNLGHRHQPGHALHARQAAQYGLRRGEDGIGGHAGRGLGPLGEPERARARSPPGRGGRSAHLAYQGGARQKGSASRPAMGG